MPSATRRPILVQVHALNCGACIEIPNSVFCQKTRREWSL